MDIATICLGLHFGAQIALFIHTPRQSFFIPVPHTVFAIHAIWFVIVALAAFSLSMLWQLIITIFVGYKLLKMIFWSPGG